MVLYFSGTGNSRFAAQAIARICQDELVSINKLMRQRVLDPYNTPYEFSSDSPFVVVCPTYCYHLPLVVESFLKDSRFVGSQEMYFFLTCGSGTGKAYDHAAQICREIGMRFMGLASAKMPENFITLFRAPEPDDAVGIVRASLTQAESASKQIMAGRMLTDVNAGIAVPEPFLRLFYRCFVHDRLFTVKENCTGCGVCAALCPTVNIRMKDGVPTWGGNCTQCQSCIAICPNDAIEFGRRTRKKRRYYLYSDGRQKFPSEQKTDNDPDSERRRTN